jgi:hypothetical protein
MRPDDPRRQAVSGQARGTGRPVLVRLLEALSRR